MNDIHLIFVIFVFFYLIECIHIVPLNSILFTGIIMGKYKISFPSELMNNGKASLVMFNPLMPANSVFINYLFPLTLSENYLLSNNSLSLLKSYVETEGTKKINIDDIEEIEYLNDEIYINNKKFLKLPNSFYIEPIIDLLNDLKNTPSLGVWQVSKKAIEAINNR